MRFLLRDKILAIILGVVLPFATLTFVAVERKISREAEDKLTADLAAARDAFSEIRRVGLDDLGRSARLVSELPYFKAAVATYDAAAPPAIQNEQVNTILPVAADIMRNVGLDFLTLTDTGGKVVTSICSGDTISAARLGASFHHLVDAAAIGGEASGCIRVGEELHEVVLVPMSAGGVPLGTLALGRRFDDRLATRIRRMTDSEIFILAGTEPIARCCGPADLEREKDIAAHLAGGRGVMPESDRPLVLDLASERYLTLWTPIRDPDGTVIGTYVMQRSLDRAMAYVHAVRGLMVVIWSGALLAALVFSFILARQITRPIQSLVGASERIAAADFTGEVPVTGTDELASLAEAFNQMNLGLRVSHEQLALTNRRLEERQKELEQSHARVLRSKQALEEINRELRDTQAQLVQAGKMAAFGELGAGIAHDLNQPLATVKGFAQLTLSRLEPSSPHRRALDLIVSAVDHMARIVAGLRNFARKSTFESAPVDVNGVIEETRLFLEHQLRRRGVLLTTELEPSLPAVAGDATQFQQVLTNLITNARDALEGRSAPAIRIATRTARGGRLIVLRVSDNGPGIPPEIRRNIFRSFFTTKEPGKGTGLGLSISRGIVQNHGGRIHAVCPSRGGTTFTIVLPALTPDKASGGHRNQDNRAA